MEHRRADPRFDRRIEVELVHEGTARTCTTRNISLSGLFIETDQGLPFAARVALKLKIPGAADPIAVEGQVRWTEAEEGQVRGVGIKFDGLRAKDVWVLNKFLSAGGPG